MPLRCLLFSSNQEMVQPIWQVLTDLGIEGEYCQSAVDAVERVTTQLFQIVITDWDDQPEAAFLLKTARDLKAAQRPLTLAIVSDNARLPEALQAGANSVLLKPLRPEQVRDTMSTACELLRAKQQTGAPRPAAPQAATCATQPEAPGTTALAAAASTGAVSVPASMPASVPSSVPSSVTQTPEKTFRAGEFLQSPGSAPGHQFDTECEVQKSMDQAVAAEVDALTELEPMAAAVATPPAQEPLSQEPEPQTPLTGWAALQARLTKTAPAPAEDAPPKSELLSYGETPSFGAPAEPPAVEDKGLAKTASHAESAPGSEAALFAYMSGEAKQPEEQAEQPRSKHGKLMAAGILAVACVVLLAVPRTRQSLQGGYRNAIRAGRSWLNPPPAALPQAAAQHDSFGQSGDEYNLPTAANIPDATTDPSQIRVLPVIDPTAKPVKGSETDSGQSSAVANNPTSQTQPGTGETAQGQTGTSQTGPGQTEQGQTGQTGSSQSGQPQAGENPAKDATAASVRDVPGNAAGGLAAPVPSAVPVQPSAPVVQTVAEPHPVPPPAQSSPPPHSVSSANNAGIPSSLKSQIAATTPDPGGTMPVEAAMSSIEPVNLPESAVRDLLTQPVDPEYPAAAKASGQKGIVVLQVLIGRDGSVQDAKFLQGSLVFARAAIDAVKQWHFKPYSMNGRAVSVQSVITLNFKPPA
jgi:TonB family protein